MNFKCGELEIPLLYITSVSYSRNAKLVDVGRSSKKFSCYEPIEVAISFTLHSSYFDYETLVDKLITYKVSKSVPNPLYIGTLKLCPCLLFNLESISTTPISDIYGNISKVECNLVFSSTKTLDTLTKNLDTLAKSVEALEDNTSTELKFEIPKVTWSCKGKELHIGKQSSISSFILLPDRLSLEFHFGDTFTEVTSKDFLTTPTTSLDSYIEIEGFGKFYIHNILRKESNYIVIDASRMDLDFYKTKHICKTETTLSEVLKSFHKEIHFKADDVPVDYVNLSMTPEEFVTLVCDNLGYIPIYNSDGLTLHTTPNKLSTMNEVEYDVSAEVSSVKTIGLTFISGDEIYKTGDVDSNTSRTIEIPFNIKKNMSEQILTYIQLKESQIEISDFPYDSRVTHGSVITLIIDDTKVPYVVLDYTIDFLSNTMTLVCNTI